ncbi:MAG: MerR family DNA-binding transcriptional regulator [Pseudomonadota bacterium]
MTGSMKTMGGNPLDGTAYGIAELAEMFGITPRAIRFYEDRGLLAPRRVGKNRIFGDRDRVRLDFILRGKRLGISLTEIREWLDLYDMEDGERRQYQVLLEGSRRRILELERQRDDLEATLKELRAIETLALDGLKGQSDGETNAKHRTTRHAPEGPEGTMT